ncbi:AfsR/SARP family transcriptional regulator [Actinophytocola sp. NPDC049390]|uniref:AfsR/SARP family transcriptional regulator n=1 Tax=Actinophytocola sp. NPDC049390 TaxID=3363894 RepID=UPI0037B772DA
MLGILGTTALLLDGGPDEKWGKPRERAVLATLAVHADQVVPIDKLLRWVWPGDQPVPANPGPTFNTYATRIRRALERLPRPPKLRAAQGGYRLEVDRSSIDLHLFRDLVAQARGHVDDNPARVVELVESAIWLWRGPPLADLASEPAQEWRERVVRNDWLAAHTLRAQALLDLERYDESVAALDELQADFPDDVQLANLRLSGLVGAKRFSDATRHYLSTWQRFRADGDEQSAQHLRRHYNALMAEQTTPVTPQATIVPRQLPHDVADFVGRGEQLAALDEACAGGSGVVILDGPGGVGKTALAVHWARRVRDRHPGGDVLVDLCGYAPDRGAVDPAAVVDDVLVLLGQPPEPNLSRRQRELLLSSLLADRRMLVVLDNARDTEHVRDLVGVFSSCRVIVTSRQRLSRLRTSTGARRITVPPMDPVESAELLSVQARGRIPEIERLVGLCGGLPLAIMVLAEDVAGRSAVQVAEFAARLSRRRLLVVVGDQGEGMSPVEACFASSYRALGGPERRLFRLLALHPGPDMSAEAIGACVGLSAADTTRNLRALVGANLLEQPEELDRYRIHDLLREFAAHRLERDEPPESRRAAQERLLDFYVASATEAARVLYPGYTPPPDQPTRPARGYPDAAEALAWFHRERGVLTVAVRRAHETACHDKVWRLADPLATYFDRTGCHIESRAVRELAAWSAKAIGEREGEASALVGLGIAQMALEDHASARRCLETALRMVEDLGNTRGLESALHQLGRLAMLRGDMVDALDWLNQGLAIAEKADDGPAVSWFNITIGRVLRLLDRHADSMMRLQQARWHAIRAAERSAESHSLQELGLTFQAMGDLSAAAAHSEQALEISEAIPDLAASARICMTLCRINTERRHFAKAVAFGRRGVAILRGSQDFSSQAGAIDALGDALYAAGEPDEAMAAWHRGADLYEYVGASDRSSRTRTKIEESCYAQTRTVPLARTGSVTPDVVVDPPQWLSQPVRHHTEGGTR